MSWSKLKADMLQTVDLIMAHLFVWVNSWPLLADFFNKEDLHMFVGFIIVY